MSTELTETRISSIELPVPIVQVRHLELLARDCSRQSLAGLGPIERALTIAAGMQQIEKAISNEMMTAVMPLMDSKLGFLTDRDPTRTDSDGRKLTPYPIEIVRRCLIESLFNGLYPVGNEWNIIADGFYVAKNGLRRKIDEFPEINNFRKTIGIPTERGKFAVVQVRATWKVGDHEDGVDEEVQVKVNSRSSLDTMQGKATRKLYAMVWESLVGSEAAELLPTGEIEEGETGGRQRVTGSIERVSPAPPGPVTAESLLKSRKPKAESGEPKALSLCDREELLQRAEFLGVARNQVAGYFKMDAGKLQHADLDDLRRILFQMQNQQKTWEDAIETLK